MGRRVTRFWENPHEGGLRRRDRRSGEYRAYVPDPLVGAALVLSPGTEALAARAEARVRALGALPDMAGIARFLLRSEAIASSRIEGVAPSAHRVALAELAQQEKVRGLSEQARAVARNVTLVRTAVEKLSGARPVTADRLLALHRSLLPDSPEHHGIRSTQNWVGGSSYHPLDADFVPPPPELVPDLVADLLTYLNGATHAPLIQAALVHAQFETIHPFADGNGRVGRALIHTVLTRRGLLAGMILPTSPVLSTLSDEYIEALSCFRKAGDPDWPDALGDPGGPGKSGDPNGPSRPGGPGGPNEPGESDGGRDAWISFFLGAVVLACDQAERISAELADVREEWNESLQKWVAREGGGRALRRDSAALRILEGLPGAPVLTIATASRIYGVSRTASSRGLETLRAAGILTTESIGAGRRAYTARAVLDTITWVERRLASTRFDTRICAPARAVPARPAQ
ncbi:Fic family protein [Actinomyces dentalis]|uniref:Fic family protein n=1 Tax=Actinomyces dentalis TaxID=272548 RepID=UPI0004273054|nr:Fic family protein [Actinomyces dentalis]